MAHMSQEEAMTVAPGAVGRGMRGLRGKNVLVTGGTSGIGQAVAVRFAEYGANIAINHLEERVHACLASVRQTGVPDIGRRQPQRSMRASVRDRPGSGSGDPAW
jgi:NAD(P)-dependent dehydrogenase (short-subunit alcohol dehydrogenase family)